MNMRPQSEETKERSRMTRPMSISADFLWGGAEAMDLGPAAVTGMTLDEDFRLHVVMSGAEGAVRFFLLPEYADMLESLLSQRFLLSGFPKDEEERNALVVPFSEPQDLGQVNQFGCGRMDHHFYVRSYEKPIAAAGRMRAGDLQSFWRELRLVLDAVPTEKRKPPVRSIYTKRDRDVALRSVLDPSKKPPMVLPDTRFDHLFEDAPPVTTNLLSEPEDK